MAKTLQPQRNRESAQPTPPAQAVDPLRAAAHVDHDVIPMPVLVIIFVIVWSFVVGMMWPQFHKDFTRFLSMKYQRDGNYAAALGPLKKLQAQDPDSPTFSGEIANAYLALGQYDEAIKWYTKAQDSRDNQAAADDEDRKIEKPDFSTPIAMAALKKGDLDLAEKNLKNALAARKLDPAANFTMGELFIKRGEYRRAVDYFKVVAADPSYSKSVQGYYKQIEEALFKNLDAETTGTATAVK